jgi:glyoxylase-like metal-dependent hydrolase (beta-lactamase superfamily II)
METVMASIFVIDTNWVGRPRAIATALLESDGHHSLIDPGPASTLSTVREGLRSLGVSVDDLDSILLTHIHLDHAGATGSLIRENPRIAVYVHDRGAPHMSDPAKLLASAGRLWGSDLTRLFGETLPVPAENLRILEGGETLQLGKRKMEVVYTPGHASHHVSYFDDQTGTAFVGDTGGIRIENGPYILPATPPPDIDLALWDASFQTVLSRQPSRLFLTHFGYAENPATHFAEFRERLHRWTDLAKESLTGAADESAAVRAFTERTTSEMENFLGVEEAEHHAFTAELRLSFLGLARYLHKQPRKPSSNSSQ